MKNWKTYKMTTHCAGLYKYKLTYLYLFILLEATLFYITLILFWTSFLGQASVNIKKKNSRWHIPIVEVNHHWICVEVNKSEFAIELFQLTVVVQEHNNIPTYLWYVEDCQDMNLNISLISVYTVWQMISHPREKKSNATKKYTLKHIFFGRGGLRWKHEYKTKMTISVLKLKHRKKWIIPNNFCSTGRIKIEALRVLPTCEQLGRSCEWSRLSRRYIFWQKLLSASTQSTTDMWTVRNDNNKNSANLKLNYLKLVQH